MTVGSRGGLDWFVDAAPRRADRVRFAAVGRRLAAFASDHGIVPTPERLLDPDVVEAFCARGLAGLDTRTCATYRWVCLRVAEVADVDQSGVRLSPIGASPAPPPYTDAERAELLAVARAQRTPRRRRSALVACWAGWGAGLRAREMLALRARDVSVRRGEVVVAVTAGRARTVPVTGSAGDGLRELAARAHGYLFRPLMDRGYKNAVNDLARRLVADPSAPRFGVHRARSSFICDHLERGTPLAVLLEIAGISEVESLRRYACHVPGVPASSAALRAALRRPV